jgi:regulator of protease activity HflC (stomatin/prohibitin superfamily)
VTYPTVFDVRVRPRIVSSRTGTKDLQQVQLSLRVLSRPKVDKLPEIMVNLGEDWDERVLPSIVNEVLKATVAQYDAEQLLTEREAVSRKIR